MQINVKYFGAIRDQLRCSEEQLQLPAGACVADALAALRARGSRWQQALSVTNLLTAVNFEFCTGEHQLQAGDELAVMPPVTGG